MEAKYKRIKNIIINFGSGGIIIFLLDEGSSGKSSHKILIKSLQPGRYPVKIEMRRKVRWQVGIIENMKQFLLVLFLLSRGSVCCAMDFKTSGATERLRAIGSTRGLVTEELQGSGS